MRYHSTDYQILNDHHGDGGDHDHDHALATPSTYGSPASWPYTWQTVTPVTLLITSSVNSSFSIDKGAKFCDQNRI